MYPGEPQHNVHSQPLHQESGGIGIHPHRILCELRIRCEHDGHICHPVQRRHPLCHSRGYEARPSAGRSLFHREQDHARIHDHTGGEAVRLDDQVPYFEAFPGRRGEAGAGRTHGLGGFRQHLRSDGDLCVRAHVPCQGRQPPVSDRKAQRQHQGVCGRWKRASAANRGCR